MSLWPTPSAMLTTLKFEPGLKLEAARGAGALTIAFANNAGAPVTAAARGPAASRLSGPMPGARASAPA